MPGGGKRAQARPPKPPEPIAGVTWQAGVTPGSEKFRVLLNGEPRPDAIAAGVEHRADGSEAWFVLLLPPAKLERIARSEKCPDAPLGLAYRIDPFAALVRVYGDVRIIPCAGE